MSQMFNETVQISAPIPLFVPYEGKPIEKMAILLNSNPRRVPLTMKRGLQKRTDGSSDEQSFRDNYFTTSDSVIIGAKGDAKILHYEQPQANELISTFSSVNQLKNYSFPVSDDLYHYITGDGVLELSKSLVEDFLNNAYAHPSKREEIFEFFARGNKQLVKDNIKLQEKEGRTLDNSMGLYLSSEKGMRLVWLGSVGGSGSGAGSYSYLYGNLGRLVGELAPEVLSNDAVGGAQKNESLDSKLVITPGEPFCLDGIKYEMYNGVYMPTKLPNK